MKDMCRKKINQAKLNHTQAESYAYYLLPFQNTPCNGQLIECNLENLMTSTYEG